MTIDLISFFTGTCVGILLGMVYMLSITVISLKRQSDTDEESMRQP